MATFQDSIVVDLFRFTYNTKFSLLACRSGPNDEPCYGKKFSPLPGIIFQLEFVKKSDETFRVSLINCADNPVECVTSTLNCGKSSNITQFPRDGGLIPQTPNPLGEFYYRNFKGDMFVCSLRIDVKIRGKLTHFFLAN